MWLCNKSRLESSLLSKTVLFCSCSHEIHCSAPWFHSLYLQNKEPSNATETKCQTEFLLVSAKLADSLLPSVSQFSCELLLLTVIAKRCNQWIRTSSEQVQAVETDSNDANMNWTAGQKHQRVFFAQDNKLVEKKGNNYYPQSKCCWAAIF